MRFSTFTSLALAATPAVVSAAGNLGFSLGVKNADGSCKAREDFEKDFDVLKQHSNIVRTYSASDCDNLAALLPAAQAKQFKVVLGIWPDGSLDKDLAALKQYVPKHPDVVAAITCGSETLYRGTYTADKLLKDIQNIQQMPEFKNIPVGTADSWNKYADGTADRLIQGGVKYFLVNAFAFWQAQEINNATHTYLDDMMQAINHIQSVAGKDADSVYIATGETGWPTDGGTNYGAAIAGTDNAKTFYEQGVCAALSYNYDVFYFEAFDEPWKPDSIGDDGSKANEQHWGLYTADRKPKFDVQC